MSDRKRNVPKKTISPIAVKNEIFRRFLLSLKLNMTTTSIYSVFLQAHYISFNRLAPVSSSNLILTSRKKLQHCDSGQKIGIICENFFFFFFFSPSSLTPAGHGTTGRADRCYIFMMRATVLPMYPPIGAM